MHVSYNLSSDSTRSKGLNPSANEYVPLRSISMNTDGVAGATTSHLVSNQNQGSNVITLQSDSLQEVLKRQVELTTYLIQQQEHPHILPKREIPIFNGDPLQYISFIRAFEHGTEEKTNNDKDRLYFLEQFTMGLPKDLIQSCQHLPPDRGYALAKDLLKEHFGNEFKVSNAYLEKVLNWAALKAEDLQGLCFVSTYLL